MVLKAIPGVEIFQSGEHNGSPWKAADLHDMARNAAILAAAGVHKAPVGIGHKKQPTPIGETTSDFDDSSEPAFGQVPALAVEFRDTHDEAAVPTLTGAFEDVPEYIESLIRNGSYRHVSAEVWESPEQAPAPLRLPGVKGPILKRVSLLGTNLPAVKTLADVKAIYDRAAPAVFSEPAAALRLRTVRWETSAGRVLAFSEATPMKMQLKPWFVKRLEGKPAVLAKVKTFADAGDATGMTTDDLKQALAGCGVDVSLTDGLSDAQLAEWLRSLTMMQQSAPEPAVANADAGGKGDDTTKTSNNGDDTTKVGCHADKPLTHADVANLVTVAVNNALKGQQAAIDKANADAQAALTFADEHKRTTVRAGIVSRIDAAITAGKLLPAQRDAKIAVLEKIDHATVHTFADGKRSLLEEELRLIESGPDLIAMNRRTRSVKPGGEQSAEELRIATFCDNEGMSAADKTDMVNAFRKLREKDPTASADILLGSKA